MKRALGVFSGLNLKAIFVAPVLISILLNPAGSQMVETKQVIEALNKKINLAPETNPKEKTLKALLAALTDQTGIHIDAEDFLMDREVIVNVSGQSAASVLNSIVELNGWLWRETSEHHILVTRPQSARPRNLLEIPRGVQASMPLDLQRYLGIGATVEDLYIPEGSRYRGKEARTMKRTPELILRENIGNKLILASRRVDDMILELLKKRGFLGGDLDYQHWNERLRQAVYQRLTLQALAREANYASIDLYISGLKPFQTDLSTVFLNLNGSLNINSFVPPPADLPQALIITGFGEVIQEEAQRQGDSKRNNLQQH